MSTNEKKANLTEINEELQKLKIEYKKEYEIYTASSSDIIESEKKFNNISKKINKIKYKQIELTNKIDNEYITNLNNYKIDSNIKITYLTLLGFPFPNQEPFYFDSPDSLIAQLSLSKDFLFNLLSTKKNEYDVIKSNYDNLNKDINILKPINEYMKLNFDIVNLLQKREVIFEENKKHIMAKDYSLINTKLLKKKIKEKYSSIRKILKPNQSQKKKEIKTSNLTQRTRDFDDTNNNSNLLSIKDFDEISGKSFIYSCNDNSILDLFNEEEINKFDSIFENETKKINHKSYNNNIKNFTLNEESNFGNSSEMITNIKSGRNMQRFSRSPDTNSNLLTEEQKNNNYKMYNKNELLVQRYRSPQNKMNKGKEILQIEKPVADSGCCASCT